MLEALANLHKEGRLPAKLRAVVSVSGVVMGTLVADRYDALYERGWRCHEGRWLHGIDGR